MIYIPPNPELSAHGVIDPGIPNRERIYFRPTEPVELAHFGLFLVRRDPATGVLSPLDNYFFWFGEFQITPPCWVVIFTGTGERRTINESNGTFHLFFWGRPAVLFKVPNIHPAIFRIGGSTAIPILPTPEQIKQLRERNPNSPEV